MSDHSVSSKGENGRITPPSDVFPTEKHADVTRVKKLNLLLSKKLELSSVLGSGTGLPGTGTGLPVTGTGFPVTGTGA